MIQHIRAMHGTTATIACRNEAMRLALLDTPKREESAKVSELQQQVKNLSSRLSDTIARQMVHDDGFIDSGSFWKLEQFFPQMHKKYLSYAKYILNITQENDKRFWDDI